MEKSTYIGKALRAYRAFVRFLARVRSHVDSEGACLDECLAAAFEGAGVVTRAGMGVVVSLQIRLSPETLLTVEQSARLPTKRVCASNRTATEKASPLSVFV